MTYRKYLNIDDDCFMILPEDDLVSLVGEEGVDQDELDLKIQERHGCTIDDIYNKYDYSTVLTKKELKEELIRSYTHYKKKLKNIKDLTKKHFPTKEKTLYYKYILTK